MNEQTDILGGTKFIKVDDDKIINIQFIRWIKKTDECFKICSKIHGCRNVPPYNDSDSVCKETNSNTYYQLLKLFK